MTTKSLSKKKLIILHFQPLEKYPPVMNFISVAARENQFQIIVCTTPSNKISWFSNPDCKIYRFGTGLENMWKRVLTYLLYNVFSFCILLMKKPDIVFFYETLSSFPVNLYSLLRFNFKLFIHYHEYVSADEKKQGSAYYRFLLKYEKRLLNKAIWISQTNEDRCLLFYNDYPFLNKEKLRPLPNYPPNSWIRNNNITITNSSDALKIVYVGSVGLKTMYIREFAEWVISMKGKIIWDLYSDHYSTEVRSFFKQLESEWIRLNPGVEYYNLPNVLSLYHVGVVLYKGHIPNFIFNVPNKIVEYLFCGLQVWYPRQMKSVSDFHKMNSWSHLEAVDFDGNLRNMPDFKSNSNYQLENLSRLSAESSLKPVLDVMKQ